MNIWQRIGLPIVMASLVALTACGNQSCYGQRYQIGETEDDVAVAIITGQREGGPDMCTQEAVFIAVQVELNEPLGERDVVELSDPELNQ